MKEFIDSKDMQNGASNGIFCTWALTNQEQVRKLFTQYMQRQSRSTAFPTINSKQEPDLAPSDERHNLLGV